MYYSEAHKKRVQVMTRKVWWKENRKPLLFVAVLFALVVIVSSLEMAEYKASCEHLANIQGQHWLECSTR